MRVCSEVTSSTKLMEGTSMAAALIIGAVIGAIVIISGAAMVAWSAITSTKASRSLAKSYRNQADRAR
jgi:hypothetical protein